MTPKTFVALSAGLMLATGAYAAQIALGTTLAKAEIVRLDFSCDTDAECAATPPCRLKPGCDGGPDSRPYALPGEELTIYYREGTSPVKHRIIKVEDK